MKSFLKQYIFYVLTFAFISVVFTVLFIYSNNTSKDIKFTQDEIKKLNDQYSNFQSLHEVYSYVEADSKKALKDLKTLAEADKNLTKVLDYLLNDKESVVKKWTNKSAESVNASLTRLYPRLRSKCLQSNISFPKNESDTTNSFQSTFPGEQTTQNQVENFGFGFSSYDGYWPSFSDDEAALIGVQTDIIKEIIEALSLSTDDNHSIQIVSIHRESVGQVDASNIGTDQIILSDVQPYLLRNIDGIESLVFKLNLKLQTVSLRRLINLLRPPFLIRKIGINPVEDVGQNKLTDFTSPDPFNLDPTPQNDLFLPIVSKVDSDVTLTLEYLQSSDRDLASIVDKQYLGAEFDADIFYEWLDHSGNEDLVDIIRQNLNEREDQ